VLRARKKSTRKKLIKLKVNEERYFAETTQVGKMSNDEPIQ